MSFFSKLFGQKREDSGGFREMFANPGQKELIEWGLSHLDGADFRSIVDAGCGSGRGVAEMLVKFPEARIIGLESDPVSIEKASSANRIEASKGRCRIIRSEADAFPVKDSAVELVTAFGTINVTPEPKELCSEAFRVLKGEGIFMITDYESRGAENIMTLDTLCRMLRNAGFSETGVDLDEETGWILVLAKKA